VEDISVCFSVSSGDLEGRDEVDLVWPRADRRRSAGIRPNDLHRESLTFLARRYSGSRDIPELNVILAGPSEVAVSGTAPTPQPGGKRHIYEPDVQPELQEDRAEEDAVSRPQQDGEQNADERRRCKVDKSPSARPATQLGANRMQSVLHPRSIGATAL
jgi:hypothetical protein